MVRREVDALLADGHTVDVICDGQPDRPAFERDGRLSVRRLPASRERRGGSMLRYLSTYARFMAQALAIAGARHLRKPYDLVQVNSPPDTLVFAGLIPRLAGTPLLLDLHECMPEFFSTKFKTGLDQPPVRLVALFEKLSIAFASHAITPTEQQRQAFMQRGAPADKVTVITNGPDEDYFDPTSFPPRSREPGQFVLICHGAVEERYGLDTIIRAVALLRDEIPGLRFEIVGRGTYVDELRRLADELGVSDVVSFSGGWIPREELLPRIAGADAGVVALKRDAFRDLTLANKMFDYVSMRRPALVSRTRSVEDYFDESMFVLFTSNDEHDLARAIRKLHDEPELVDSLIRNAAEACEQFSWPRQRELYREVVNRLLASRARSGGAHRARLTAVAGVVLAAAAIALWRR
jgi:glycosyltransferase involved in cell wall biosynthesis